MLIRGISALSNSLEKTYRGGVDIKCKISTGKIIMGKKVEENKTEENAKVEELIKRKGSQDFAQDLAQVGRQIYYWWPLLQISESLSLNG